MAKMVKECLICNKLMPDEGYLLCIDCFNRANQGRIQRMRSVDWDDMAKQRLEKTAQQREARRTTPKMNKNEWKRCAVEVIECVEVDTPDCDFVAKYKMTGHEGCFLTRYFNFVRKKIFSSQHKAADELGLSQSVVSKYLASNAPRPFKNKYLIKRIYDDTRAD